MVITKSVPSAQIMGSVDTHKDLHVVAMVDQHNRIAGTEFFPATRQSYRQMLNWMASFGYVNLVGIEHRLLWRGATSLSAERRYRGA